MSKEIVDEGCVLHEIYQRGENRCFVQRKLYEVYFKPDGVSLENSRLCKLENDRPIIDLWTLRDHNEASRLLMICKGNMEEFKAFLPSMNSHLSQYIGSKPENVRVYYKQIIDFYEATGFLEELPTLI